MQFKALTSKAVRAVSRGVEAVKAVRAVRPQAVLSEQGRAEVLPSKAVDKLKTSSGETIDHDQAQAWQALTPTTTNK